jgi:hypothetical protein
VGREPGQGACATRTGVRVVLAVWAECAQVCLRVRVCPANPTPLLALQFPQYPSPWAAYTALQTDYLMGCPARRIARWLAAAGAATFLYSFTHEPVTQLIVRVPRRRAPTRTLCVLCVVCRGFCVLCWVLPV